MHDPDTNPLRHTDINIGRDRRLHGQRKLGPEFQITTLNTN
jgi:hypothetical protein